MTPSTRGDRQLLGTWDLPLWSDWLAYLTVFAVIPVLAQPTALDLVIAVSFQLVLFGFIPGAIRNTVRGRRQPRR